MTAVCLLDGCDNPVKARGMCNTHYTRWRKHGDPSKVWRRGQRMTLTDRFWSKVDRSGSCWLWVGKQNNRGYGIFHADGRSLLAHRVAYELEVGPIPDGLTLDHVRSKGCRNRHCVNPDHLEPVTQRENVLRGSGFAALNAAKTHCPRGHQYTPENTYANPHPDGGRICRTCKRERDRLARARRRLEVDEPTREVAS
jgi:hypothetical protein